MKKVICMTLFLVLIIGLLPVTTFAEETISGEIVKEQSMQETEEDEETEIPSVLSIQVYEEDGYCAVTRCDPDAVGEIVVPESVNGYPVTRVGMNAFRDCTKIESVILPDCMKVIGRWAFYNCSNMTNIELGKRIYNIESNAFMYCSKLKKLTFYDRLTWFQADSLSGCDELESIEVIGNNSTFYSSDGVLFRKSTWQYKTTITLEAYPHGRIGSYAIPTGVRCIGDFAFYGTKGLTDIIFPSDVASIRDLAFAGCTGLTEISLPDKITSISYRAFAGCTELKSVHIPENVTTINGGAFMNCSNLELVSIPSGVNNIWETAFEGCSNLSRFEVSEYNNYYSTENDVLFNKDKTELLICSRKKTGIYTIPSGVEGIARSAFDDCSSITALKIPLSLVHIYYASFNDNNNLMDIYYEGSENDKESMTIRDSVILNAIWHFNSYNNSSLSEPDDELDTSTAVRYFREWDAENQIAYFGQNDLTGSQVTDETDTSFLENLDNLLGQYVLVESKDREDDLIAPKTLISIKPVETKVGTVTEADTESITIGEETYATPDGLMLPDSYVGEIVLYQVYEGKIKGIEILEKEEGTLTYWNVESRELKINESYTLSSLADAETIKFLGETGSRNDTVYYYADSNNFVYQIRENKNNEDEELESFSAERDGWCIPNNEEGFGYQERLDSNGKYHIPFPRYEIFDANNGSTFSAGIVGGLRTLCKWNGSCFGMSILAASNYKNIVDISKYTTQTGDGLAQYGLTGIENVDSDGRQCYTIKHNLDLVELVERAHISQISNEFKNTEIFKDNKSYSGLVNYLSGNDGDPILVTLEGDGGHAVLIDPSKDIIDLSLSDGWGEGWFAVYLYDPNVPANGSLLENPKGWYNRHSYLYLNRNTGQWKYYLTNEQDEVIYVLENDYYFFNHCNIRFYDVTELGGAYFTGKLTTNLADELWYFSSNIDISVDAESIITISDNEVTSIAAGYDYDVYFEDIKEGPKKRYMNIPSNQISYESSDAEVIFNSCNHMYLLATDGLAKVDIDSENAKIQFDANDSVEANTSIYTEKIEDMVNLQFSLKPDNTITVQKTDDKLILNSNSEVVVDITYMDKNDEVQEREIVVDDTKIINFNDFDHIHTYTYTDNGGGTHTKYCVDGDDTSVEEHSYVDGVCEFCGAEEHVHSYGKPVFLWSDDYNSSKATFTCTCGDSYTMDAKVTVEEAVATCTENGKKVYTATVTYDGVTESDTETVTIPAKGHQYVDNVVPPTETEKGYTEHTCSECGDMYRDTYTDPIGEHGHTWDEGVIIKEATCTENGERTYTCTSCEETKTEVIKAMGHDYHNGVCSKCGDKQASVPVTPVKPVWKSWLEKITNQDYLVSVQDGTDSFLCDASDVTIILSTECVVSFKTNGGNEIPDQKVQYGEKIICPDDPVREGYRFDGWYTDIDLTDKWNFDKDFVQSNISLYAKWTEGDSNMDQFGGCIWWWIILIIILVISYVIHRRKKQNRDAL